jgi:hypothetical protein
MIKILQHHSVEERDYSKDIQQCAATLVGARISKFKDIHDLTAGVEDLVELCAQLNIKVFRNFWKWTAVIGLDL